MPGGGAPATKSRKGAREWRHAHCIGKSEGSLAASPRASPSALGRRRAGGKGREQSLYGVGRALLPVGVLAR